MRNGKNRSRRQARFLDFVNSQSNVHSGKWTEVTMGKVEVRTGKPGKGEGIGKKAEEKSTRKKPGRKISQRNIHRQMT